MQKISIVFTSDGATFSVNVGHLNPIETLSGAAQRLQNLGFLAPAMDLNGLDVDTVRAALQALQAGQSDGQAGAVGWDAPPSSGADDGSELSDDPFGDDDDAGDVTKYDDYAQDGTDPPEPASLPQSAPSQEDGPGMSDDGTPDDQAKKLLLDAHGS